ncbi:MAG: hypothetical protein RR653_13860 [Clostridia bacterium]
MHIKTFRKQVLGIALSNMDSWVRSPRVWTMVVCAVVYCIMQVVVDTSGFWVMGMKLELTLPEKLFTKVYNGFYSIGSLLFLVMVSEIPRRISFQQFLLVRASRVRWMLAQCVYCAMMVLSMILLLTTAYLLIALPGSSTSSTFTDTQYIQAGCYEQEDAFISAFIRKSFTPWTACLFAGVPLFLFWYTMVLMILMLSLLKHPLLGPSVYGFLLLARSTLLVECLPSGLILPTDFSSLGAIIAEHVGSEAQRLMVVISLYIVFDALLIYLLFLIVRRMDFCIFEEE